MITASILLATYNGEKYIIELLDSLRMQDKKPDEVIIVDDFSTDSTVIIIKDYIKKYSLYSWKLIVNINNKGWKINFKNGFDLCSGDYIFPCDQDDIWHPDKLDKMINCLLTNDNINVLVSNYNVIYEKNNEDKSFSMIMKSMKNNKLCHMVPFNIYWDIVLRPGCTFCFKRSYYKKISKYWNERWAYDAFLWMFSCADNTLALFNYPTIEYRRHENNVYNNSKETRKKRLLLIKESINIINSILLLVNNKEKEKIIYNKIKFYNLRISMLENRNILMCIPLFIKYRKYYLGIRSYLGDILISIIQEYNKFVFFI